MDLLFGRRKTPEELLRQNQRALNRAMRELDRERQKLETQEKKIIADIKKMAKQGQMLKLPQIQKIMMEFERQAEIMDMKEEMMNDAIDDAMGDEDDEEESDAVVAQVLDELGLSLTDELSSECPDPGPCPARSSATAQTLPLPALLLSAGALFLTPLLCRPPVHRRLPQCGCQWEESRGCRLRPSRCRCRPGGAAQEPSKGLTAPPAPCHPREPAEGPAFSLYLLQ
uniref:Charged multivesicular body protein 2A n=1 Tax=Balaenoptera musculus TaxID=9771 RepID=A0A8C0E1W2_BALMU